MSDLLPLPPASSPSYRTMTVEEQILRRLSKLEETVKRLDIAEGVINAHDDRLDEHEHQLKQLGLILDRVTSEATTRGLVMDRVDRNLASILEYVKSK